MTSQLPAVGARVNYASNLGTVRYIGEVNGSQGIWLGVEWDDPQRGRHSGDKDGKQYFTCTVLNSATFVRPSVAITLGCSFLHALLAKYVEGPFETPVEKVVLGSSKGAIEVEAVGMNKVRNKLSRLERLREVSLDMENVASPDPPGQIRDRCPSVKGLDLSRSLIPTWDSMALIAGELPLLETLSLNFNRFQLSSELNLSTSFSRVQDLRLNGTLATWEEVLRLLPSFPALSHLELGLNRLRVLTVPGDSQPSTKLASLNFEGNQLHAWPHIVESMSFFTQLDRLILSDNMIESIPPPRTPSVNLRVKHLALASNSIRSWSDIDALREWFPELKTLNINFNPIAQGTSSRPLIIARLSSLVILNASAVSAVERRDSELFFLTSIVKNGPRSEEGRDHHYPRYRELCERYGKPEERGEVQADTMRNRLINVHFFHLSNPVSSATEQLDLPAAAFTLRILPSMTLRVLCSKVLKTLKISPRTNFQMWLMLEHGSSREFAELDKEMANRPIEWWGIENECKIAFCIAER